MNSLRPAKGLAYGILISIVFWVVLCLVSMSCSAPATLSPHLSKTVNKANSINTFSAPAEMVVTAEKLNIRTSPGGEVVHRAYLMRGDIVTVYEVQLDTRGYQWCRTGTHWVGCNWLKEK